MNIILDDVAPPSKNLRKITTIKKESNSLMQTGRISGESKSKISLGAFGALEAIAEEPPQLRKPTIKKSKDMLAHIAMMESMTSKSEMFPKGGNSHNSVKPQMSDLMKSTSK